MGGEVPKSYYINNKKPESGASGAHLKSELVPAGNRKRIEIIVEEAKSLMRSCLFVFQEYRIIYLIVANSLCNGAGGSL
jgi:hypothetical protein